MPAALSRGLAACALALTLAAAPARADGEFTQLDVSRSTIGGVGSIQRGALSFGGVVTLPDGDPSAQVSVTYGLSLPLGATLRVGPAVGLSGPRLEEAEVGARAMIDRYLSTSWGSLYGLAEVATVDRAGFGLVQAGFGQTGLTAELSHGASTAYVETTLALSKRLGTSRLSLRAGWRFAAEEAFVGFSYNTF